MSETSTPHGDGVHVTREREERVRWLELFFDLVVVACLGALTEGLRDDVNRGGIALFMILYAAIWMTWVNVVLYANIARAETHIWTVITVMVLIAIMGATSPGHFEERANAFAIAFLAARAILARRALQTGRLLSGWPLLQFGGLSTVWIVAMFIGPPLKYGIWAAALILELALVAWGSKEVDDDDVVAMNKRFAAGAAKHPERPERRPLRFVRVSVDADHLAERLGVFVIIVLGESMIQIVHGAAASEWSLSYQVAVGGGFLILVGLWWLRFSFGASGTAVPQESSLEPRFALPLHLFATMGIALLAAGLGELAHGGDDGLDSAFRWVMGGGMAMTFGTILVGGLLGGAARRWLAIYVLPGLLIPLALAGFGSELRDGVFVWLLLVPIAWPSRYAFTHRVKGASLI